MKSHEGGTKDENSESLFGCIRNTCVSSLCPNNSGGEQKCGCFEVRGGDAEVDQKWLASDTVYRW